MKIPHQLSDEYTAFKWLVQDEADRLAEDPFFWKMNPQLVIDQIAERLGFDLENLDSGQRLTFEMLEIDAAKRFKAARKKLRERAGEQLSMIAVEPLIPNCGTKPTFKRRSQRTLIEAFFDEKPAAPAAQTSLFA